MRKVLKLTLSYLRFNIKQTLTMLIGIILSTILLSGISSMIYSGRKADIVHAKREYGNWHYQITDKENCLSNLAAPSSLHGYALTKCGTLTVKQIIEEPYQITFCSADEVYMNMMGRTAKEGSYPTKKNEVAVDYRTINNLGLSDKIGDIVIINGREYSLCGILSEGPEDCTEDFKVFVSKETTMTLDIPLLYVVFDEHRSLYSQIDAFAKTHNIEENNIIRNNDVTRYMGGEPKEAILDTIITAFSNPKAGLVYMISNLNTSIGLINKVIFLVLLLFSVFVNYSIYTITLEKRNSDYAVLQVIGLQEKHLFSLMFIEQFIISLVGYPIGCFFGNQIANFLYQKLGYVFTKYSDESSFYIAKDTIVWGAIFFSLFILLISYKLVRRITKQTDSQLMKQIRINKHTNRTIYAKKSKDLTTLLTKRFMFGKFSTFVGIIFSLSLGGILFLSTTYIAQSTKVNMNHKFLTDENLGGDINIHIDSTNGSYVIPKTTVEKIKRIKGIAHADEMSYLLGEFPIDEDTLQWKEFFPELSNDQEPDQRIHDNYNGIVTKQKPSGYLMKANVYGYTDHMLTQLKDYLIKGKINAKDLKDNNNVILKTITDGQGNTDGCSLKVGDTIKLKVPNTMSNPNLLKFKEPKSEYIVKEFTIAAIVNRPLAKNTYFIGDTGTDTFDIIMSNEQMLQNFQVDSYNVISIGLKKGADSKQITQNIQANISQLTRCIVNNNTEEIDKKNQELNQKVYFFYGIAAILLCISLLHIVNSMKHNVLIRRHEFGIIRAMGITNHKFRIMMFIEGLRYGIYASVFMLSVYAIIHRILQYLMQRVYLYIIVEGSFMPKECLIMITLTILICTTTLVFVGNTLLKEDIIEEIH